MQRHDEDVGSVTTIRVARFRLPRTPGEEPRAVSAEAMLSFVAHESWHCWQYQLTDMFLCPEMYENEGGIDEDRATRYIYNHENYIQAQDDPVGYRSQLLEAEAISFGSQIREKLMSN